MDYYLNFTKARGTEKHNGNSCLHQNLCMLSLVWVSRYVWLVGSTGGSWRDSGVKKLGYF